MPLMLGPESFGLPMAPRPNPAASSIVRALMAKHGITAPAPAAVARPSGPAGPVGPGIAPPDLAAPAEVNIGAPSAAPAVIGGDDLLKSYADATPAIKKPGLFDHIRDFLGSDEGRAEALRFGMGAFQGGIGGGLAAATSFADKRRAAQAEAAQNAVENALKTRDLDQRDMDSERRFELGMDQNDATRDHYERSDANDADKLSVDVYKHRAPSGDALTQAATTRFTHSTPSGDTVANIGEKRFEHITPSGDAQAQQAGENYRATLPPKPAAEQPGYTEIVTKTPAVDASSGFLGFGARPATPETTTTERRPIRPSEVKPSGDSNAPARVTSDADYAALPSGTRFIGPDGQVRVKP